MARKTPEQITAKFRQNMASAGPSYEFGVQNPSRPWEEAAAAGAQRWQVGVQEAISRNAFAKGVAGKGGKWARKTTTVGVQRFTQAASSAAEEYGRQASKILSIAQASADRVAAMPNSTFEERMQKAFENARFIRDQWREGS